MSRLHWIPYPASNVQPNHERANFFKCPRHGWNGQSLSDTVRDQTINEVAFRIRHTCTRYKSHTLRIHLVCTHIKGLLDFVWVPREGILFLVSPSEKQAKFTKISISLCQTLMSPNSVWLNTFWAAPGCQLGCKATRHSGLWSYLTWNSCKMWNYMELHASLD